MNTQRAVAILRIIQRHLRTHKEYESAEDVNLLIDYVSAIQKRLDAAVEEACRAHDLNAPRSPMVLNKAPEPESKELHSALEVQTQLLADATEQLNAMRADRDRYKEWHDEVAYGLYAAYGFVSPLGSSKLQDTKPIGKHGSGWQCLVTPHTTFEGERVMSSETVIDAFIFKTLSGAHSCNCVGPELGKKLCPCAILRARESIRHGDCLVCGEIGGHGGLQCPELSPSAAGDGQ